MLKYFNEKFFKLSDLDLDTLYLEGNAGALQGDHRDLPVPGAETPEGSEDQGEMPPPIEGEEPAEGGEPAEGEESPAAPNPFKESRDSLRMGDIHAALPNNKTAKIWESNWSEVKINVVPLNESR